MLIESCLLDDKEMFVPIIILFCPIVLDGFKSNAVPALYPIKVEKEAFVALPTEAVFEELEAKIIVSLFNVMLPDVGINAPVTVIFLFNKISLDEKQLLFNFFSFYKTFQTQN